MDDQSSAPSFAPTSAGPNSAEAVEAILRQAVKRKRPRVLVIGNYGAGNTGDEAVLAGLSESLSAGADVTVLSRQPNSIMDTHGLQAVPMVSLRAMRTLLRTDVISVGGGGMFGKGLPPLVAVLPSILIVARFVLRKRILLLALGVYPDTPRVTLLSLQIAARMADGVFLRDERSVATLGRGHLGRKVTARLVGDPALFMDPAPVASARRLLAEHDVADDEAPLVLSVKPTPDLEANDRVMAVLACVASWWVNEQNTPVVILPLSVQGDYGLGRSHADSALGARLRSLSPAAARIRILPAGLDPRLSKAVIGEAAAVVGMRFHALVFAVGMGRPVLGIVFEHKATAWMAQVGAEQLPVEGLTADAIIDWLETTVNDADRTARR
jgi:polysaccharide pyruvyl transferase WcaK-like protein